ncbi:MAG: hypothetical protein ACI8PZ_006922 [Myxococcota bacterium]|jgi:hypothetical protein
MHRPLLLAAIAYGCQSPTQGPTPGDGPTTDPASPFTVEPARLVLGPVSSGETTFGEFTVTFDGDEPVVVDAWELTGDAGFTVVYGPALPDDLAPGNRMWFDLAYTPPDSALVEASAQVTLSGDAAGLPLTVDLRGLWSVPAADVSPTTLDLGSAIPGDAVAGQVTLSSVGDGTLVVTSIAVEGEGFGVTAPALPLRLDPRDSLDLDLSFLPARFGPAEGALVVHTTDPAGPLRVPLTGAGEYVESATVEFTRSYRRADVLFLLDTSAAMDGVLQPLASALVDVASDLGGIVPDVTYGVATFTDYPVAPFGEPGDLPFELKKQQSNDYSLLAAELGLQRAAGGGDTPSAACEALVQAALGDGYDLACDGVLDDDDVPPFVPWRADAFGGVVPGSFDPSVPGTGGRGGVGLRDRAQPVIVLVTNTTLRNPDEDGAPGGCPAEPNLADAASALGTFDAKVVGINAAPGGNAEGRASLERLAIMTGSMAILDEGGVLREPAVVDWEGTPEGAPDIAGIVAQLIPDAVFESVAVEVDDPGGVVLSATPLELGPVTAGEPWPVEVEFAGRVVGEESPETVTVTLTFIADDSINLGSQRVFVVPNAD